MSLVDASWTLTVVVPVHDLVNLLINGRLLSGFRSRIEVHVDSVRQRLKSANMAHVVWAMIAASPTYLQPADA